MDQEPTTILLIEDNPGDARLVKEALAEAGAKRFALIWAKTLSSGLNQLKKAPVQAILLDLNLPESSGFATFEQVRASAPHLPVIILTGLDDEQQASRVVREGAQDYLVKGEVNGSLLLRSIRYAIERKQVEERLRRSEENHRTLVEQASDGIFVSDPEGKLIDVTSSGCRMLGYSRQELLERSIQDLITGDDQQAQPLHMEELRTGKSILSERPVMRADGSIIMVEINARGLSDGRLQGIVRDITERKRAERSLLLLSETQRQLANFRTAEEVYRLVGERVRELLGDGFVVISVLDESLQVMRVSGMYGFGPLYKTLTEMFSQDPVSFTYPLESMTAGELRQFRSGRLERFEGGLYRLMLGKVPRRVCAAAEKRLNLDAIYTMGFVSNERHFGGLTILARQDIAPYIQVIETITNQAAISLKRVLSEQALSESEERYRLLIELSPDAIAVHQDGKVVFANSAAARLVGGDGPQALIGRPMMDFVHPDSRPLVAERTRRQVQDSEAVPPAEEKFLRLDGSIIDVDVTAAPFRFGERPASMVIIRDITERKQAEERIIKLNECFLNFGADTIENINHLTALAGELLEADCALYNRLDQGMLCSWGKWQTPPGYNPLDNPEGHICFDVIQTGSDQPLIIRDLPHSPYANTDPNVQAFQLKTYIGKAVQFQNEFVGSLCMVYQRDFTPSQDQERLIGIISSAIAVEETRRHAEDALHASEERYRSIFENTGMGVFESTVDGNILQVNMSYARMFGFNSPQAAREGIPEIAATIYTHPEARTRFVQYALEHPGMARFENTYRRKDGTIFTGALWLQALKTPDDRMPHLFGFVEDITERKRAEEALRLSEERYRTVSDYTYDWEYWVGVDGIWQYCSPSCERITGYPAEKFMEDPGFLAEITLPEDRPLLERHQERPNAGTDSFDFRIVRKDGEVCWVAHVCQPITTPEGKMLGRRASNRDVTERLQAEADLRASEARFSTIFHSSSLGISITRMADNKLVDVNEAWEALTGYGREQVIGRTPAEMETWAEARERDRLLSLLRSQGSVADFEMRLRRHSGELRDLLLSADSIELAGEPYLLITALDITERKRTESRLEEAQRFSQATIDALSAHLCVLDANGTILTVNQAWREFAERNPPVPADYCVGTNYLAVCDAVSGPNGEEAAPFAEGLRAILRGEREDLSLEYPCNVPDGEKRWFNARVTRFSGPGPVRLVVAHENITARKQVEEAVGRQAEELARLYRASGSLISSVPFDLQSLSQTIVDVVLKEFGQSNCSVFLVQKDTNDLDRIAVAGPYADRVSRKVLSLDGPGQVPEALRTRKVINASDVRVVPSYVPSWEDARSELTIPLLIGDQVIGAIDVQSAQVGTFKADDERMMSVFAERAALSLEHARLFAETERRLNNLASLRTIDLAISSSFDLDITLGILLDQVITQLGIHAADILVFNPGTQTFRFSVGQGFHTQSLRHTNLRLGDGYAGRAARERHSIKIQNLNKNLGGLERSQEFGREGFVTYIGVPLIAKGQIKGVLEVFQRDALNLDQEGTAFLDMLGSQAAIAIDNADLFYNLQSTNTDLILAYDSTLAGWASALELRDKETVGHTRRVADLTTRLAETVGVNESDLVHIHRGALLHDIGKMGIPDSIVLKPGPLTDEEWEVMRRHPQYAYEMLAPIPYLGPALDIPYCHHEKWDGSGYPRGLKAEQIPLSARIFSVVDVWDALTSDRPYRKAWPEAKVRDYIREQSGIQFDPKIVEAFLGELFNAERR